METQIYNQTGEKVKKIKLPAEVFALPWKADLVHQVVVSLASNRRDSIAHTKNRGDVRGGGKKPWKQKGTGRARHGSRRSPIWRGGGITFGPISERNWSKKINKKAKITALFSTLSQKMRDGEILFVDDFKFEAPKTKEAHGVLKNLSAIKGFEQIINKKKNSTCLALGKRDEATEKSFSNFGNMLVSELRNLNPLDILEYKYLIITQPEKSIDFLMSKLGEMTKDKEVEKEEKPKVKKKDPKSTKLIGQEK